MIRWRSIIERVGLVWVYFIIWTHVFLYVDKLNQRIAATGGHFVHLECWLDKWIPFVPEFAWAYYLYFGWVFLIAFVVAKEDKPFYHGAFAFAILQAMAFAAFVLFPSRMQRPVVVGDGLSIALVRYMYKIDSGYSILPSLHVAHTVLVTAFYKAYKPKYFPVVLAGTTMICLSTVFIKQHYVIDIPFGVLFGLAAFYLTAPLGMAVMSLKNRVAPSSATEQRLSR